MYPHVLVSSARLAAFHASWTDRPLMYLALAALSLLIALRLIKWATTPTGALVQAVPAAAVVALAIALALALVAAVALSGN